MATGRYSCCLMPASYWSRPRPGTSSWYVRIRRGLMRSPASRSCTVRPGTTPCWWARVSICGTARRPLASSFRSSRELQKLFVRYPTGSVPRSPAFEARGVTGRADCFNRLFAVTLTGLPKAPEVALRWQP